MDISDEELARRLHTELNGGAALPASTPLPANSSGPQPNAASNWQLTPSDLQVPQQIIQASQNTTRFFGLWLSWAIVEIIVSTVVTGVSWKEVCDVPLNIWLILYTGRFIVTIPLELRKLALQRRGLQENNRTREILNFVFLVWFVIGNSFLYNANSCTKGALYWWCVCLTALTWFIILIPIILLLCLPCVVLIARYCRDPPGADARTIASLPTRRYLPTPPASTDPPPERRGADVAISVQQEQTNCAICMEDFHAEEELRVLPCSHQFHTQCVDPWLSTKDICPLCRAQIPRRSRWIRLPRVFSSSSSNNSRAYASLPNHEPQLVDS